MKGLRILIVLLFAASVTACATAQPQVKRETAGAMGIYGNWCGLDHPTDVAANPLPIDALDAACRRHDLCYTQRGFLSCECDAEFTQELRGEIANSTYTGLQLATARATHAHFAASPCVGDMKAKTRPVRFLKGVYDGTKRRVVDVYNRASGERVNSAVTDAPVVSEPAVTLPAPAPAPAQ